MPCRHNVNDLGFVGCGRRPLFRIRCCWCSAEDRRKHQGARQQRVSCFMVPARVGPTTHASAGEVAADIAKTRRARTSAKRVADCCGVHRVPPLLTQDPRAALRCRQPSRGGSPACPVGPSCPGEGAGDGGNGEREGSGVRAAAVRIANLLCDGRPPRPSRVLLLVGVECQENEPSVQFALCSTGTRPIEPDSSVPTIPAQAEARDG